MSNSKTFLFAGASSLMAMESAVALKKKGHTIIGLSRRPVNSVFDMLFEIPDYTAGSFPELNDLIDGLVYFPGSINLKPFNRLSAEEFNRDYQINSLGAAAFVQAYLNNLKRSKSGSIVFISTVAVQTGLPFHASIAMAKGAIEGLTRALAAELSPGIRVNCIAPSLIDTPLAVKFIDTSDKMEQMKKRNPMRRIGEATDIAAMISFLLSDESSWITGQVLQVGGGMDVLRT